MNSHKKRGTWNDQNEAKRFVKDTIAQRNTIPISILNDGDICFVKSDGNDYKYLQGVWSLNADVTATAIATSPTKTTPVDSDNIPLIDSADTNKLKKVTWKNVKTIDANTPIAGFTNGNLLYNNNGKAGETSSAPMANQTAIDGNGVYISNPIGGIFKTTVNQTGALKIILPVSWSDTMLMFWVDIFIHGSPETYYISGYNSSPWALGSATCLKSGVSKTVRFGHDGTKCCVYIGELNTVWSYPQVLVKDFHGGVNNATVDIWKSGWKISFETTSFQNITGTVSNPLPYAATCMPTDNNLDLGGAANRLKTGYFATPIVVTSDENDKMDIKPIGNEIINFMMDLDPSWYSFNNTGKDEYSIRRHAGLISQQVYNTMKKNEMESLDFAGFICTPITEQIQKTDDNGKPIFTEEKQKTENGIEMVKVPVMETICVGVKYGLRYEEFISPLIRLAQKSNADNAYILMVMGNEMPTTKQIKQWYEKNLWTTKRVYEAVSKCITEADYFDITSESYV